MMGEAHMTIALWCVLAAALLPYLGIGVAKLGGPMPARANANPREWVEALTGFRKRGRWYEANAYEAFPPFAAAVIIAQMLHAPQNRLDELALAFIAFRVAHFVCYVADLAAVRTAVWFGGMACVVALFFAAP